jgi:hypothetical protein
MNLNEINEFAYLQNLQIWHISLIVNASCIVLFDLV